jgi:putative ABC transport system permease protein
LGGQALLVKLLASITATELPPPGILPAITAFGTGVLLLFGFALPPLIALAGVPPLRVLRRDLPRPRPGGIAAYLLGAGVIAVLIAWQAQDATAGAIMIGGIGGLLAAAALSAWLLIVLLKRLRNAASWRFGSPISSAAARVEPADRRACAGADGAAVADDGAGDLMRNWRASLRRTRRTTSSPTCSPTRSMARAALKAATGGHGALSDDPGPARRGQRHAPRYRAVRRSALRRLAEREFNLSWSADMPGRIASPQASGSTASPASLPESRWSRASPTRSN